MSVKQVYTLDLHWLSLKNVFWRKCRSCIPKLKSHNNNSLIEGHSFCFLNAFVGQDTINLQTDQFSDILISSASRGWPPLPRPSLSELAAIFGNRCVFNLWRWQGQSFWLWEYHGAGLCVRNSNGRRGICYVWARKTLTLIRMMGLWHWKASAPAPMGPFSNFHRSASGVREMGPASYRLAPQ